MFQNINKNTVENNYNIEDEIEENEKIINNDFMNLLKKSFSIQNIILYTIAFMISMVSFGTNKEIAPFGVAMIAAILSSSNPIAIPFALIGIANTISFGFNSTLMYILTTAILLMGILIKAPRYDENNNEKRKIGIRLFLTCLTIKLAGLVFKEIIVYDILLAIMYSVSVFIFYKIFSNAIPVINKVGKRNAFSIEEVMGASLTLAIAVSAIGDFAIFGYSVRNIICILIVMIMGWENGILIGGTTGITIGTVLAVIGTGDISQVATYALSGMIAGLFSKFGKIGVILGFIIGNVVLVKFTNINTIDILKIQEILIAALGLLAIPKKVRINIEEMYETKLLPETTARNLEENKDTISKLNTMSETLSEIARSYKEAAATIIDEEDLKEQEKDNFKIFEKELYNNIESIEDNILFDDLYTPKEGLIEDIFKALLEKDILVEKDLIEIFARYNNYIIMTNENKDEITQVVKIMNYTYRVSRLNFIWKKKLDENKKAVSNQLQEVSNAIESLATDIQKTDEDDKFEKIKKELYEELEELDIKINSISIKEDTTGKKTINIYTDICKNVEKPGCNLRKMTKAISKVLNENVELQNQECGLRSDNINCVHTFTSINKQELQIGIATATKEESAISGDSNIQTKLKDGKFLIAISDGMGTGQEARKNSKMAIGMLDKLLASGFDKDASIRLINSTLSSINEEDMFATLDIAIFDLYSKNLEFIKNGACPTYVKRNRNVDILKSLSLPTGIINDIDLIVYDKDLQDGDILVMCSDGIIDSTHEFTNKELWIKFLLEEIETDDCQKIADIILHEAIDNNYGKARDDMTVIVTKVKEMTH